MRPRYADTLRELGYAGELETFWATLLEVKREVFPSVSDEDILIGKDSSARFCVEVRTRLNAPRLTRAIILKGLIGIRKSGRVRQATS